MKWLVLVLAVASLPAAAEEGSKQPAAVPGAKAETKPAAPKPAAPKPVQAKAKADAAKPPEPAPSPAPPPRFRWEIPGLIAWVDSPGVQISDGVPLVIQAARSRHSVESLLQHFARSFEKAGFFIPPGEEQVRAFQEPQLTALDPQRLVSYTVIFQENPDDTVTLILGTADLSRYTPEGSMELLWAPLPPGARQLTRTEMEGGQSAVFFIAAPKEQVMTFYREALSNAGFEEMEPAVFRRGGEVISVYAQPQEGQLAVSLTRRLGGEAGLPRP